MPPSPTRTMRTTFRSGAAILLVWICAGSWGVPLAAGEADCFKIEVIDSVTGRGVPLVELRTVNDLRYYTDSAGIVAFDEPGLLGQEVYFHIKSHGYEFPKDGFGLRGKALETKAGGSVQIKLPRKNLAERLYRITGAGIYAESVKAGLKPPTKFPLLNGKVLGSDTVLNANYQGKLFWVWGDTNRPQYPLGNFQTPAGISQLPSAGGLDPEIGIDLNYFIDAKGFAREMCAMPGEGPTWVESLMTIKDQGRERLLAGYVKVKPPLTIYAHGLAIFQDDAEKFEHLTTYDEASALFPSGHVFAMPEGAVDYRYFCKPFPLVRVRATLADLKDPTRYEAYTCLEEGTKLADAKIARKKGKADYAWRKNTPVVTQEKQREWVKEGKLKPEEALISLRDVREGKPVLAHHGSVSWNNYRDRWVSVFVEHGGSSSLLGEVWYAEADEPTGPWVYAVKVASHDKYTFYNPKLHPQFNTEKDRVIFFEGTYTNTFSGNSDQTPRYDYNQMMYKLDLGDERTSLPVAVYQPITSGAASGFVTRVQREKEMEYTVPFFAYDRHVMGSVPVLKPGETAPKPAPMFYALPADGVAPRGTALLYEFTGEGGASTLALEDAQPAGMQRAERPVCRVWLNPCLKN